MSFTLAQTYNNVDVRERFKRWSVKALIVCLSIGIVIEVLGIKYKMVHNYTESLPQPFFVVEKNILPEKGQFIAFRVPRNPYYQEGTEFVKIVGGVTGDVVSMDSERNFYVNGHLIGKAKEHSKTGQPLATGPVGRIPAGRYFVYTPHKDSYDSRYKDIGWVSKTQVVGKAITPF